MIDTELRLRIAAGLSIAAVCAVIIWQRSADARFQQQLDLLREENARLARLSLGSRPSVEDSRDLAKLKSDYNELTRVRNEHIELLRLRGEVGVLRSQLAEAQRQATSNKANPRSASDSRASVDREAAARAYAMRAYISDWTRAFYNCAMDNGGQFPTTFKAAQAYYDTAKAVARPGQVGRSARSTAYYQSLTPDDLEIVYQGSLATLTNAANTIVIRERLPRQRSDGTWARNYGFADGASLQRVEAEGDFEAWEKAPQRPPNAPRPARLYSLYGQG